MSLPDAVFQAERRRLFGLAYRMLGRASEAEDVLQEAWIRVREADTEVRSPAGFLTTIVTRLCLDRLGRARERREEYVGPWLPEPIDTSSGEGTPDAVLARAESISMAFLRILEALGPVERAVFLLKESFDYRHGEIGEMLGISTESSRQHLRRARERIAREAPRFEGDAAASQEVARAFFEAARSGDPRRVVALLHPEVEWTSDGGGVRPAARRPVVGAERVAALLAGLVRKAPPEAELRLERINGGPALVASLAGQVDTVIGIDVEEGRVARVWAVRNPEKLRYLQAQLAGRNAGTPAPGGEPGST